MMTIAGLEHHGKIYMAADSLICSGQMVQELELCKIIQREGMLFGVSGSALMINALRYRLVIPANASEHPEQYLNTVFLDALRECFEGVKAIDSENLNGFDGTLLIGYCGKLYKIDSSYVVFAVTDAYNAIGSGRDYALAAMAVLDTLPPGERVKRAVEVAIKFDIYSGGVVKVAAE